MDEPHLAVTHQESPAPGIPRKGAPGSGGPLVAVNRQIMGWDEKGMPIVLSVPTLTPTQINDIGAAAIAQPYSEPGDELALELGLPPSEFYGRPLMEVMLIKQARHAAYTGDKDEVEAILDRRLGKPKSIAENHNINETYEGALKRIHTKTVTPPSIQDAEIIPSPVDEL